MSDDDPSLRRSGIRNPEGRVQRSFAEQLLSGDAVSPSTFLGERSQAAFARYREVVYGRSSIEEREKLAS